jgi:hypothetical protein
MYEGAYISSAVSGRSGNAASRGWRADVENRELLRETSQGEHPGG